MSGRGLRSPWTPLCLVAAVGAAYAAGSMLAHVGAGAPVGASVSTFCAAAAAVSCLVASHHLSGRVRSAWWRIGLAAGAWFVGDLVAIVMRILLGRAAGSASLADLFYILAVPLLVAGFAAAGTTLRGGASWARVLLDSGVCAGAVFWVSWVAVFASVYRGAGVLPVAVVHPGIDVVMLCLVGTLVLRVGPGARRAAIVTLLGVAVAAVTDAASSVAYARGAYPPQADIGWVVAYLLVAVSPWTWRPGDTARDVFGSGRFDVLIPTSAAAAATMYVLVGSLAGGPVVIDGIAVVLGALVLLALLVRLTWTTVEEGVLRNQLRAADRRFRILIENWGDAVAVADRGGVVLYAGDGWRHVYGYQPSELVDRSLDDLVHPEDFPRVRDQVEALVDDAVVSPVRLGCRLRGGDGTWRHAETTLCRYGPGLLLAARDVSDQVALQEQLAHLAFHDGLTGLPNRAYFEERTREVLARRSTSVSVLFIDLDGFAAVNDSEGHASGDHVLTQAARRLRGAAEVGDTVARFGSDEFAVLVEGRSPAQSVVDLGDRLVRAISEPFRLAGRDVALTASVGVAFAAEGPEVTAAADLLRDADVAMARAKSRGGGRVEVFAASMRADIVRRLELVADLQRALAQGQFAVEYQPVVDLATSRVTGVEALVRWWRGSVLVPPQGFIGQAEESGLIVPLGRWVLREACRQVAGWRGADWNIGVAVNLSARQLSEPRFVQTVSDALAESGLPATALTLEVTEDVIVEGADDVLACLSELRALGVRLAIDDFGTGYASLAYLRQLPADTLKIDPSFVGGLGRDEILTQLTRAIVRLGRDLGLLVVAEGIERPEQLDQLREMGCAGGQGFLVARPMAARGVESLLRTGVSPATGYTVALPGRSHVPTR
ncbi:MAG: putative bifunctional diguanylate cyclase/phosphodiesterase [Streptosporangiaceae bacterium]